MSMYQGVYVGVGWLVDEATRNKMLNHIVNTERRNEVADCFHRYNINGKWFFGEMVCEIEAGDAKNIETLAALPGLTDDGTFGFKYGMILYDCGFTIDEINEEWGTAQIYFVHWVDC